MAIERFIFGDAARKGPKINVAMNFLRAVINLDCSDDDGRGERLRDAPGRQIPRPALIVASPL
jgi:hypothetical protein